MKELILIFLLGSSLSAFQFGTVNLGKETGKKAIKQWQEKTTQTEDELYRPRDSRLLWISEPVEGWAYWGSIAISGDTIYMGTSGIDGSPSGAEYTNTICAINKSDGKIKWKFNIDEDEVVKGAITVANDGTIYFITIDMPYYDAHSTDHGGATYLYALNSDGTKKWKKICSSVTEPHFWGQTSPAIDSDGIIYIYVNVSTSMPTNNAVIALNPSDGSEKWRYELQHAEYSIWPAPTVSSGVVYAQSTDSLYAISSSTGGFLWKASGGNSVITSPVINSSGDIYCGQGRYLIAYSSTGVKKLEFDAKADIYAQPVIGEDGTIYLVTSAKNKTDTNKKAGYFWAINSSNGSAKWMFDIDQWMYDEHDKEWKTSDCYGPAVVGKDGTIYFTTEYKYLWALNPDGTMKDIYDLTQMPSSGDNWTGGQVTYSALVIDEEGILYRTDTATRNRKNYCAILAIKTHSYGIANSPWPKGYKNNKNTNSK